MVQKESSFSLINLTKEKRSQEIQGSNFDEDRKRAWQTSLIARLIRLNATINAFSMRNDLYVFQLNFDIMRGKLDRYSEPTQAHCLAKCPPSGKHQADNGT